MTRSLGPSPASCTPNPCLASSSRFTGVAATAAAASTPGSSSACRDTCIRVTES